MVQKVRGVNKTDIIGDCRRNDHGEEVARQGKKMNQGVEVFSGLPTSRQEVGQWGKQGGSQRSWVS